MPVLAIVGGTVATVDDDRRVIEDGTVLVRDGRIAAVGPRGTVPVPPGAEVIDAAARLVLPGLIDAHAHAGHGLVKTMGAEDGDRWEAACETIYTIGSDEAFWRAEARLAALERLRFGVTAGVSMLGGGDMIMRVDDPVFGDLHCRAYREVGVRSLLAVGPTRPPFPRTYARRGADGGWSERPVDFARMLETTAALIRDWHGRDGNAVRVIVAAPTIRAEHLAATDAAGADRLAGLTREALALARDAGVMFTQDGHVGGSVRHAHAMGVLGPDVLLSHATGIDAEEVRICADTGTRIAHNPSAVAAIRAYCPVPDLLDAGVLVALGSDGTAPDRSGDMFRHMQQCMHHHRTRHRDPRLLPPGRVLEMCTRDAARALGLGDELGSVEVGKRADLILLDLTRPHLAPRNMPVHRAVCFANGNDVETVIVDGRVLMRDRRVTSVDEAEVAADAEAATARMLERTGLAPLLEPAPNFWRATRY